MAVSPPKMWRSQCVKELRGDNKNYCDKHIRTHLTPGHKLLHVPAVHFFSLCLSGSLGADGKLQQMSDEAGSMRPATNQTTDVWLKSSFCLRSKARANDSEVLRANSTIMLYDTSTDTEDVCSSAHNSSGNKTFFTIKVEEKRVGERVACFMTLHKKS